MHRLAISALCLGLTACSPSPTPGSATTQPDRAVSVPNEQALLDRGQSITSQAFGLLSSNLLSAIQQSGVSNALPFCSALAMPLTRLVADTNEVGLRRVSHRPRNPANRANAHESELIERCRATLATGGKPQPSLWTNDTITFYAPILITNSLCLQCHGKPGQDIALETLEAIRRIYPNDEATGFGLGDIRGLWRIDFRSPAAPAPSRPARSLHPPDASRPLMGSALLLPFVAGIAATMTAVADDSEPADQTWFEANYTKHEHYIPMRDGARLFTAIYTPKDDGSTHPIWLTRTPYGLRPYGVDAYPNPDHGVLHHHARDQYIFVVQDVRGCNRSDGEFVHMRPILDRKSEPHHTDESTDAWDTIDWLIRHLPNHNGRVGLSGISYPGFYAAAGAIDSHPALKAVSPQAPIADQFIGDDFHHHGAFFLPHAFHNFPLFEPKREKPARSARSVFAVQPPPSFAPTSSVRSSVNSSRTIPTRPCRRRSCSRPAHASGADTDTGHPPSRSSPISSLKPTAA